MRYCDIPVVTAAPSASFKPLVRAPGIEPRHPVVTAPSHGRPLHAFAIPVGIAPHGDIEVYDNKGRHLGSMHPTTGELYKPPVKGRTIE